MRLHHLALWSRRIELLRDFYTTYFDGRAGEKYENPAKGFESYFVTFADGVSLELMRRTDVTAPDAAQRNAVSIGKTPDKSPANETRCSGDHNLHGHSPCRSGRSPMRLRKRCWRDIKSARVSRR